MFAITTEEEAMFLEFCENNHVYKGATYAFTFDERFLVYYYKQCNKYVYIALDTKTGLGSQFISTDIKYKKSEFETLIPNILNSLKYLGELRYLAAPAEYAK
ncbi:MAG: hypothetical protein IJ946_08000 [Clostridia bacterium]|mgnify:CR=1 FL=1|nr:hypothetical protein [Clostridia bacterium]